MTNNAEYKFIQAIKEMKDNIEEYQFDYHTILGRCFNENEEPNFRQEEINRSLERHKIRFIDDMKRHLDSIEKIKF